VISGSTEEGSSLGKVTIKRGSAMSSHMESGMKRQLREERRSDRKWQEGNIWLLC
jgi:hypothetical protein